ncbi:MAG: hypothetical protein AB8G26_09825 [Ilumatobacter sp.]
MITTDTRTERSAAPRQLTLLSDLGTSTQLAESKAHARFRLSKTTRTRGLAHVAEIRAQLAEAQARREATNVVELPTRRADAA